jgi:3-oxoacyl-[acyl-carrier protein] reductase
MIGSVVCIDGFEQRKEDESMELGLTDKIAWVPSASQGLGAAIARELAREGARVVISARREEVLQSVAESITADTGASVTPMVCDNTSTEAVNRVVEGIEAQIGPLDILINNSGAPGAGSFTELDDDAWKTAIDVKLMAQIRQARAVFDGMVARGSGRILNIVGTHARFVHSYAVAAGVVNAGLLNMTKALAQDGAPANVLVNALSPGPIATERHVYLAEMKAKDEGIPIEEARAALVDETLLKRFGTSEEIAAPVVFLVSSRASFITGAYLEVDGGQLRVV